MRRTPRLEVSVAAEAGLSRLGPERRLDEHLAAEGDVLQTKSKRERIGAPTGPQSAAFT